MKKHSLLTWICICLLTSTFAQTMDTTFQKKWEAIDSLILKKDLPGTALSAVQAIYQEAKKNNLSAQSIKALLYKIYLQDQVEETDPNTAIHAIQNELAQEKSIPGKAILYSILAHQYLAAYQADSWRIRERSATIDFKKEDIQTWSQQDFITAIRENYLASLQHEPVLKATSLKGLEALIVSGKMQALRPTLYDLLAHEAIDYFKNAIEPVTIPVDAFAINDPVVFAPAELFIKHAFLTQDTVSADWQVIQLFQQLLSFHQKDKDPSAFIDVDLERMNWMQQQANLPTKDSLYKTVLEQLVQKYPNEIVAEEAWYLLAQGLADNATKWKEDPAYKNNLVKAKALIEQRLKAQPAPGKGNSEMQTLLNRILATEVQAKLESVNVPGQPFRLLLSYKNMDKVFFRVLSKELVDKRKTKWNPDSLWTKIAGLPFLKNFDQALPNEQDYLRHSVELKIDALPVGEYVLLGSSGKDFAPGDKLFLVDFTVSNMACIVNDGNYFVVDRDSGEPLKNVQALFTWNDWEASSTNKQKTYSTISDKNGFFTGPVNRKKWNYQNVTIVLTQGQDVLRIQDYYRNINYSVSNTDKQWQNQAACDKQEAKLYFFTDRSIYRPGQVVYFKGIGISKDYLTKKTTILTTKDPVMVTLLDVNGSVVDSISCTVNEFGSLTGKFILPEQVLPGNFSMAAKSFDQDNRIYFRVEEYKRPRFFIRLDTLQTTFQLHDTVTVTGQATAFAGNAIDGARVKYTVTRMTRFIYPWFFWRRPQPQSPAVQIAQGELQTDAQGLFAIPFTALPDRAVDKNTYPVFDFEITVTITDINGETHTLSSTVSVGYQSLLVQIEQPAQTDIQTLHNLPINVTNFAGQKQDALVHLRIAPIQAPATIKRNRYWEKPDLFVYTKKEFETYFPYDEYADENDIHTWQVLSPIVQGTLNTKETNSFSLDGFNFTQGWYLVEAYTMDKNGDTIRDKKYIELTDKNKQQIPAPQLNWNNLVKTTVQPREKAIIEFGSSEKNIFLLQAITHQADSLPVTTFTILKSNGDKTTLTYTPTEKDRKGAGLYYAFVRHNRFYTGGSNIYMPYIDKELQITYQSFRDKMEPGSRETWTVRVSGRNASALQAELCTAMYDASLDQFIPHEWQVPGIWQNGYASNNWSGRGNFEVENEIQNYLPVPDLYIEKTYDHLITQASMYWKEYMRDKTGGRQMVFMAAPKMSVGDKDRAINEESKEAMANEISDSLQTASENTAPTSVAIRKNFNETAFFFPQLHADSSGNFSFSFTMPEALTQWKWLTLAHTKEVAFGYQSYADIVTQKKLMVQPNLPRFLREGDRMELSAKISNMSDSALKGVLHLELYDPETNEAIDGLFNNVFPDQYFSADAGKSMALSFPIQVPFSYTKPLAIRFVANANQYTDGEENILPVLSNRILVTETFPLFQKGDTTRKFVFEKLEHNQSATLQTQSLTVEYTANPVWYAIQALPYLTEFPYECAEQLFNRYYANAMAGSILAQHPRIKAIIEKWQADTASQHAFLSNLQKNQNLKQIILEETPWIMDARNEAEQKKNIALLFDLHAMQSKQETALHKLQQMQLANGAFSWFKGGYPDRYITQYILTGIGRLRKSGAISPGATKAINAISKQALHYLDDLVLKEYNDQIKNKNVDGINRFQIQYMYMRSYFMDIPIQNKSAYNFYFQQCMRHWNTQSNYMKAMIGMMLFQAGQEKYVADNILASILENGIVTKDRGMYWKENNYGYYWYEAPIEVQSLFIELTKTVASHKQDTKYAYYINEMNTWLILQKQTNHWATTKATADACFALLWQSGAASMQRTATIQLGTVHFPSENNKPETGTGYWQETVEGKYVTPDMSNITVTTTSGEGSDRQKGISFGAVYWQYFENVENVTSATSSISIAKNLFIEKNTGAGNLLSPVAENAILHVGDKVILRMVVTTDRDLEYVHLKDGRAAAMEPLHVLSGYQWQDGLSYYEATKDAATDFFIDRLKKGTYVFEYPVYITQKGNFAVGIATLQCMYAPEFSTHSNGLKIVVE